MTDKYNLRYMLNIVYDHFSNDIKIGFDGGYWYKLEKFFFCLYLYSLLGEEYLNFVLENVCSEQKFNDLASKFVGILNPELFSGETIIEAPKDEFDEILDKIGNQYKQYRETEIYNLIRLISFSKFMETYDRDELLYILEYCSCPIDQYNDLLDELMASLKNITAYGAVSLNPDEIIEEENTDVSHG